jgi:hypothetical protein
MQVNIKKILVEITFHMLPEGIPKDDNNIISTITLVPPEISKSELAESEKNELNETEESTPENEKIEAEEISIQPEIEGDIYY